MKKISVFFIPTGKAVIGTIIAALISSGCVSINSEKPEDRLAALSAISSQDDLFAAIAETRYNDVADAAASRLTREDLCIRAIERNDVSEPVRVDLVKHVSAPSSLRDIALRKSNPDMVRLAAVSRLKDDGTLAEIVVGTNPADCESLQIAAAKRIDTERAAKNVLSRDAGEVCPAAMEAVLDKIKDGKFLAQFVLRSELDPSLRLKTVKRVDDEAALFRIASTDWTESIRLAAANRVSDSALVAKLAREAESADVRLMAVEKVDKQSVLADVVKHETDSNVCLAASNRISDPDVAAALVKNVSFAEVRRSLTKRIVDEEVLAQIAENDSDAATRLLAASKVTDPALAADIARTSADPSVQNAVLLHVEDDDILCEFAEKSGNAEIRRRSVERIRGQSALCRIAERATDKSVQSAALSRIESYEKRMEIVVNSNDPVLRYRKDLLPPDDGRLENAVAAIREKSNGAETRIGPFYIGMDPFDAAVLAKSLFPKNEIDFKTSEMSVTVTMNGVPFAETEGPGTGVTGFGFPLEAALRMFDVENAEQVALFFEKRGKPLKKTSKKQQYKGQTVREQAVWLRTPRKGVRIALGDQVKDYDVDAAVTAAKSDAARAKARIEEINGKVKDVDEFMANAPSLYQLGVVDLNLAVGRLNELMAFFGVRSISRGTLGDRSAMVKLGHEYNQAKNRMVGVANEELHRAEKQLDEFISPEKTFLTPGLTVAASGLGESADSSENDRSKRNEIRSVELPGGVFLEMVKVPFGDHLYFGQMEITQDQWASVMGSNPSKGMIDGDNPVDSVSWFDCKDFIDVLNGLPEEKRCGLLFRLPKESEWMKADEASQTPSANDDRPDEFRVKTWRWDVANGHAHTCGVTEPNEIGLCDTTGNVWEWCDSGEDARFQRTWGCSWKESKRESEKFCDHYPDETFDDVGFRVCAEAVRERKEAAERIRAAVVPGIIANMVPVPGKTWLIGKTEVTAGQWFALAGLPRPSDVAEDLPARNVSWKEVCDILDSLNSNPEVCKAGLFFRLPTREEWKYACLAGSEGTYCNLEDGTEINERTLASVAWFSRRGNGLDRPQPAARKKPNAWGLFDMSGNVGEWTDSEPDHDEDRRYVCGGGFNSEALKCSADSAEARYTNAKSDAIGFRLCADPVVASLLDDMATIPGVPWRIGKTEVPQWLWNYVMGYNPSACKGATRPVENVSWKECMEFVGKLNSIPEIRKRGIEFGLPSQSAWQYACLGNAPDGSSYDDSWLENIYCIGENGKEIRIPFHDDLYDHRGKGSHPVATKRPNAFGLFDMNGNVKEWTSSKPDAKSQNERIVCGGGFNSRDKDCSPISKTSVPDDARSNEIGFRLCVEFPE